MAPLAPRDPLSPRVQSTGSSSSKNRKRSSSSHNSNSTTSPSKKAKENQELIHLKTEVAFDLKEGRDTVDKRLFGEDDDDDGVDEVQFLGGSENADGNIMSSLIPRFANRPFEIPF